MAGPRTTKEAVQDILSTSLEAAQIVQFIEDASLWVDEELGSAGLTVKRLELIERYLTCALIRLRDLGLKSSRIKDVQEQYQVDADVTDYLLRAASFDPTGRVRAHFLRGAADTGAGSATFRVGERYIDQ